MKVSYVIAALIFVLGIGLLIFGTSGSEEVTLLGLFVSPAHCQGYGGHRHDL